MENQCISQCQIMSHRDSMIKEQAKQRPACQRNFVTDTLVPEHGDDLDMKRQDSQGNCMDTCMYT